MIAVGGLLVALWGVAVATLNRPRARNALDVSLVEGLREALEGLRPRIGDDVMALVLTGAGGHFCAGGDLRAMRELRGESAADSRARLQRGHRMLVSLMTLELPVMAAVRGAAVGAGFNLALACDFVLAGKSARFAQSFQRVGLVPDYGGLFTLPRLVGLQRARELAYTARTVEPEEAEALGLVLEIHEDEALLDAALRFARRFRHASSEALGATKLALLHAFEHGLLASLDHEAHAQSVVRQSAYHREAVDRFLAKEPAIYDWDRLSRE